MASFETFLKICLGLLLLSSSFVAADLLPKQEKWKNLVDARRTEKHSEQPQTTVESNKITFSQKLFQAQLPIASYVRYSCFIGGIAHGNLNPVDFGKYNIQKADYLYQMYNHLTALNMQAVSCSQFDVAVFAFDQAMKYGADVSELFNEWDIKYAFCIESQGAMKEYIKFQKDIMTYYPTYYSILSALPRHMLWDWLGKELKGYKTKSNIYAFWICEECDSSQPWETFVNDHSHEFDEDIANRLFRIAMIHEFNFFSTICSGRAFSVPEIPPSPTGCASKPMPITQPEPAFGPRPSPATLPTEKAVIASLENLTT